MLLRVRAASAHIGDWHVMTGLPYLIRLVVPGLGLRAPKAPVRGMDVAGRVEAVGKDVTRFQPGDEVFGICKGSFAEFAIARPDKLAPKPANLTFEQAATVPISGLAALQAVRDGGRCSRAAGADHRRGRSRGDVRGADRQGVRRPRHGRVQHVEGGPGPVPRRRRGHRLHARGLRGERAALRRHPRHRGSPFGAEPPARAHAQGSTRHRRIRRGRAVVRGLRSQPSGADAVTVREPEAGPVRLEGEGRGPGRAQGAHRGRARSRRSSARRSRSARSPMPCGIWKRDTPAGRSSSPSEGRGRSKKEGDRLWDSLRLQRTRPFGRETGTVRARWQSIAR